MSKTIEKGLTSVLIGIGASLILAAIKILTGLAGNSFALVADGIESLSDVMSSLIVFGGLKISQKPADWNHPYGHGKAEPIAAAAVSIGMVFAAMIIIYQSLHEIITPHHAPASFTIVVLILVIITKEILFKRLIKTGNEIGSIAIKNDAWHHRSDAITSAAAAIGISIALIGGPGYESADDWAALFASSVIIFNAIKLFRPAMMELMDHLPDEDIINQAQEYAKTVPGVVALDKCRIRKAGFDYYGELDVIVNGSISVSEGHILAHRVKNEILSSNLGFKDIIIHIEPDDDEHLSRAGIIKTENSNQNA